ncbi:MAG: hypothetical protein AB8G96_05225 [Phycisphaerales bacterium]
MSDSAAPDSTASHPAGSVDHSSLPRVRAIIDSIEGSTITLALAHTDYRLSMQLTVDADRINVPVGKRIKGVVEADGMRFHAASGGGRFIEPVYGEPRIIAGTVLHVAPDAGQVLVDAAMPIWVRPIEETQDWSVFADRVLVTGYLKSGPTFTPDPSFVD